MLALTLWDGDYMFGFHEENYRWDAPTQAWYLVNGDSHPNWQIHLRIGPRKERDILQTMRHELTHQLYGPNESTATIWSTICEQQ